MQDDAKVHLFVPRFSRANEISALFKLVGGKSLGEDVGGVVLDFHIVEISVAERLGVWASACTSGCRNIVDTSGVSPATAGRWHSSRVRPQCPDPGQLERETQVQGPMGNLHLRGHSLWPGTWEGREGCFCNTAPPQIHRIGIPRCRSA
jgi:hypothetical protein